MLLNRQTKLTWRKERQDEMREARVAALLIGDELDSHARQYALLHRIGRTPERPIEEAPNFLGSTASDGHQESLARLTVIPMETWRGLQDEYHNAKLLRVRIMVDGPNATFPPERLPTLKKHEEAANELSEILFDAAEKIAEVFGPIGQARRTRAFTDHWRT